LAFDNKAVIVVADMADGEVGVAGTELGIVDAVVDSMIAEEVDDSDIETPCLFIFTLK
jgi:hypothetical protein